MTDNGLIAIGCALFMGYSMGRWRRYHRRDRCVATIRALVTWEYREGDATTLRCNQDAGHTGPHGAWWRLKYRWWWGTSEPSSEGDGCSASAPSSE